MNHGDSGNMTDSSSNQNWRVIADAMKSFVGKQECQCTSTPEYAEWQTKIAPIMERGTPAERMLYLILEAPEFENAGIAEECERCRLLDSYWNAVDTDNGDRPRV